MNLTQQALILAAGVFVFAIALYVGLKCSEKLCHCLLNNKSADMAPMRDTSPLPEEDPYGFRSASPTPTEASSVNAFAIEIHDTSAASNLIVLLPEEQSNQSNTSPLYHYPDSYYSPVHDHDDDRVLDHIPVSIIYRIEQPTAPEIATDVPPSRSHEELPPAYHSLFPSQRSSFRTHSSSKRVGFVEPEPDTDF